MDAFHDVFDSFAGYVDVTRGGSLLLVVHHYCHVPENYCKIPGFYVACCRLKTIMQTCSCLLSAQIASKTTYAQTHLDLR